MSYEEHKMSAEKIDAARWSVETARKLLAIAEGKRDSAAQEYERILEEGKAEAPETVAAAYEEYMALLKGNVSKAMEEGDLKQAGEIIKKMEAMQEAYSDDEQLMPQELERAIQEMFKKRQIIDSADRTHFLRVAMDLTRRGVPSEVIEKMLGREMSQEKPRVMTRPSWTGQHKARNT